MRRVLPEIERLGGRLVAITPEQPDDSLSTAEKDGLTFDVLTDKGQAPALDRRRQGLIRA
jgi:peroxiredoxin